MTLGERRVIVSFNPSEDPVVSQLKRQAADLIDAIDALPNINGETARWKAEAITNIETGAMFGVKAATAGQIPGFG